MVLRILSLFSFRTAHFVVSLLLVAGLSIASQAKPSFSVKAPPAWVKVNSADLNRKSAPGKTPASKTGSSTILLDDYQVRISDKGVERYYHYAQKIETTAGLDDLSKLQFYFEPSYQQLTIHSIHVYRDGNAIDALKPNEVKIIQKEEELNQQLYNGTLSAVVFVNDLRVGDVVDYAYTVSGDNPVLGGRFAERVALADSDAAQRLIVRVLCPTNRPLEIKKHNTDLQPSMQAVGEETEYLWDHTEVAGIEAEDSIPGWVERYPTVDLSEFKTWEDVTRWALPLFKLSAANPSQLEAKIQSWKALPTPEERLIAALRFVQDEVRYLGIEMGRYSHQPSQPATVFTRRFGDCKDKSFLLTTVLNELGIDAAPALVNARLGKALDDWQPSPFAFNHVIVQAKLNGRTYWLDATINSQRGGLGAYYDPPYARALVVREGTTGLEKIPMPSSTAGSTNVNEIYKLNNGGSALFSITITYSGADADEMRATLASQSVDDLGKASLNFYAAEMPSIRANGDPSVRDDEAANTVTITEAYTIDSIWKGDLPHLFTPDRIYGQLQYPSISKRSLPLEIEFPLNIHQTTEIELPGNDRVALYSGDIRDAAFSFTYKQSRAGNRVTLEYSLRSLADHVPADQVARHIEALDQMRNFAQFQLPNGSFTRRSASGSDTGVAIGLIVVLAGLGVGAWLLIRHLRKAPEKPVSSMPAPSPGSTPETAISVKTSEEILTFLIGFKCRCGERPYQAEAPPVSERFTYDERRLTGVRLKCHRCGQFADLYFNPQVQEAPAS